MGVDLQRSTWVYLDLVGCPKSVFEETAFLFLAQGLDASLLKVVDKQLPKWSGEDHLEKSLAHHLKKFDETGSFILGFYDKEAQMFYLSLRGLAKRKMDQYSNMLAAATGYEVYDMPVSSIQSALTANGMDGLVQPTSRAMMTLLLSFFHFHFLVVLIFEDTL